VKDHAERFFAIAMPNADLRITGKDRRGRVEGETNEGVNDVPMQAHLSWVHTQRQRASFTLDSVRCQLLVAERAKRSQAESNAL
jgi:hypothetical protein